MAVSSETIEIRLSGFSQLRQLETQLTTLQQRAAEVAGAIASIGEEIQDGTRQYRQLGEVARRIGGAASQLEGVTAERRTARQYGSATRRRMQRQARIMREQAAPYEESFREYAGAVRTLQRNRRQLRRVQGNLGSEITGIAQDQSDWVSTLLDTQRSAIRQLRGTRRRTVVRGTRSLIEARLDDSRRLGRNRQALTGRLAERDRDITEQTTAAEAELRQLERNQRVAIGSASAARRVLRRQQRSAILGGNEELARDIGNQIVDVMRGLYQELDAIQSTRSSIATSIGRLNQRRRSLRSISRGRSTVYRKGEELIGQAEQLSQLYGVPREQLRVQVGQQRLSVGRIASMARGMANRGDDIEGAKELLGLAQRRITSIKRRIDRENKVADADQKQQLAVEKLTNKLNELRTSGASGQAMQRFEQLASQAQGMAGARNRPEFNRLMREAMQTAALVPQPKGFMRGPASPIGGAKFIEGSPLNITEQRKAARSAEVQQRKVAELIGQGASNLPSFQRFQATVQRLPQLQQAGDYNELNRTLADARTFAGFVRDDLKARGQLTKRTNKYEDEISKIAADILAGKKVERSQVDKLLKFNELRAGGPQQLALPPAAPGAPAFSGGARPGLRGTESVIGGIVQPRLVERLGGARTDAEAISQRNLAIQGQGVFSRKSIEDSQAELTIAKKLQQQTKEQVKVSQAYQKQRESGLNLELDQRLAIERAQERLQNLELAGVSGSRINRARSLVQKLPTLSAEGRAGEFARADKELKALLGSGERSIGQAKTAEQRAKSRAKAEQSVVDSYGELKVAVEALEAANKRAADTAAGIYNSNDLNELVKSFDELGRTDIAKSSKEELKIFQQELDKTKERAKRLERSVVAQSSGLKIEQDLLGLQAQGVEVSGALLPLQQAINKSRENGAQVSLNDLNTLEQVVKRSGELAAIERSRLSTGQKTEQQLNRQNDQTLAIEKRQRKLAELQAKGVNGPAIEAAQSLVNKLPGLAARGAAGAGEFTRVNRRAAQALAFATPSGTGKAKTPEQIARNFDRELSSAQVAEQNLIGLSKKNVNVSSQLLSIQDAINQAKRLGASISEKDLDALKDQVATARDFVKVENARLANAPTRSTLRARKAASESRLAPLQRDTLTSGLIELGRADVAAKVFRGGRSGEQALSDAIEALNKAVLPDKPTSSQVKPDTRTGVDREIDRYKQIFAGLTSNPRFYGDLLSKLPREAITTTMAGAASDRAASIDRPWLSLFRRGGGAGDLEGQILSEYQKVFSTIPSGVKQLFDKIGSVFDAIVGRTAGAGGGGRPPGIPPIGGGGDGGLEGQIQGARGNAKKLLGLADLVDFSQASNKQLELFSAALAETRDGLKATDAAFNKINKVLTKTEDALARRDPNADFLTRRFGHRGGQAVGEGLIGGAFPLLFGQGAGASVVGGLGGFFGGMAGGTLGFGLSLAGTAIGGQVDALAQAAQDTGNMLRDLTGNFEQIKESGLLASRGQEKLVQNLIEAGNKTAAYAIIQAELNSKLGTGGAAQLKAAADAGDRLKRAMADLGVQMQIFIAGPLTELLKKMAEAVERRNVESALLRELGPNGKATKEAKAIAQAQLNTAESSGGGFANFGKIIGQKIIGGEASGLLFPTASTKDLNSILTGLIGSAPPTPQTREEKQQEAVRNAETRRDLAQRNLDIATKLNEPNEILKGFKQQAIAARREQEDVNRQSFELRRDYERQIEDIRRGIEDRINQLRQENAQKELEILAKQGQIREQQLKNASTALQGALAGDPLAQSLADAVTTYLGAQMSAQDQLEQRRKQFEIEVANQQIETEKYKLEVGRTLSKLNTDTAEKVAEINRNVRRSNENTALNEFKLQKESAKLRAMVMSQELKVMLAKQSQYLADAQTQYTQSPTPDTKALVESEQRIQNRLQTAVNESAQNIKDIEAVKQPQLLREVSAPATRSVSFAGVNQGITRANQLREQLKGLEKDLVDLVKTNNLELFANQLSDIAFKGFFELNNSLQATKQELAAVSGDTDFAAKAIANSYDDLFKTAEQSGVPISAPLRDFIAKIRDGQIAFEKIKPSMEFYVSNLQDVSSQTKQSRAAIDELLLPVKAYDRELAKINARGGLGINPEEEQMLLKQAKALDEINAQLKILEGLRDIASGWTDSFIQLNKELLKGGNLLESVQRFAESVADRTLDVVLEFTLRPIQERLFKNMTDLLGIKAPEDPALQPIRETAANTKIIADEAKKMFAGQTGVQPQQAAAANAIVPGPMAAAAQGLEGRYLQGGIGPKGPNTYGPHFDIKRADAEYFDRSALDKYVEVNGRPISAGTTVSGGSFYSPRKGRPYHGGWDYAFGAGATMGLMGGAKWISNKKGGLYGDKAVFMTPDGSLYEVIHGQFKGAATPVAPTQIPAQPTGFQVPGSPLNANPAPLPGARSAAIAQSSGFTRGPGQPYPLPVVPQAQPAVPPVVDPVAQRTADSLNSLDQSARGATDSLGDLGTKTSDAVAKLQQVVGTSLQAVTSIAMGIGGAQMIRRGGAYNTLMGAASIFGSISSITGMFGTGGPLSGLFRGKAPSATASNFMMPELTGVPGMRALGGPVYKGNDYLVGEQGPEVIRMGANGTVVPADELYIPGLDDTGSSAPPIGRYARRTANNGETTQGEDGQTIYTGNYGRAIPYQRSESSREIERLERVVSNPGELPPIRYETSRVNEYYFVTPEQLEESNMRTAKMARNQTIRELADSMKTRKRLGL